MKALLLNLGMLFGVLLCAGGVVVALITGFDPLFGSAGLALAVLGALAAWACRRATGERSSAAEEGQRSRQHDDGAHDANARGALKRRSRGI
ncbi:MAG: hypothetical protein M5U26_04925 [Planctomycetota bacterium]|nr:hypothetical protein [Planctomycetota bacterium]